jgi:uncharacterized protein (DUF1501 family)
MSSKPSQACCNRREFLKLLGAAGGSILASQFIAPEMVLAQSAGSGSGKNLILINLNGGCDGLQLVSYSGGALADTISGLRPTISTPRAQLLSPFSSGGIASPIGLHPAMQPLLQTIATHGRIIQKYGILADVGRSHDLCQLIMDLGASQSSPSQKGFMAKFADELNFQLFQYWGFSDSLDSFGFNTDSAVPLVVNGLDSLSIGDIWSSWGEGDNQQVRNTRELLLEAELGGDPVRDRYKKARTTISNALVKIRTDFSIQVVGNNSSGNYDDSPLGKSLKDTARVLKAKYQIGSLGLASKTTAISLAQGGYDHHSGINDPESDGNFPKLVSSLAKNLAVFVEDLKSFGGWEKTAIVVFSEFGRTNYQNGSIGESNVGTDHGWGSNTFVLGGAVTPGVSGDYPTTAELVDDDINALVPTTDYRDIFSDVFRWIGVEPKAVFDEAGYSPKSLGLFA